MLISLKHRFIFVANLKTASSSIEICLRPFCEIAIPQTTYGKHLTLAQMEARFSWIFEHVKRQDFFVFGVLRDPVDYVISIYNSHQKKEFIGFPHYTGDKSFEEFYESWTARQSWQMQPQSRRFVDINGDMSVDYLLDYNSLNDQWMNFCLVLGVPASTLGHHNLSPQGLSRNDLPDRMIDRIYGDFEEDDACLRFCAGFCGTSDPSLRPDP